MATLIAQVDSISGNYEQSFRYTVDASFNGIVGNIDSAQIKIFFPNFIDVSEFDVGEPIKNITETEVPSGKEVTFDFGTIENLGIAIRISFSATFNFEASGGSIFLCSPVMYINGEEFMTAQSEQITLVLNPQFEITKEMVLPDANPAAGGAVFYKVTLQNFGDLGVLIENVEISCEGSDILTLDSSFDVIGNDSSTKFSDKTADGIEGVFVGNTLTFAIPKFRGERYEFIYRAVVLGSVEVGSEISSVTNWSIDSVAQQGHIHTVTSDVEIYNAVISLYGPYYSMPSEYICYRISMKNTGNQVLEESTLKNDLPQDVDYYRFSTGSFYIGAIKQNVSAEYYIDYFTVNGEEGQLGPYNTDVNQNIELSTIISQGDNLSSLVWRFDSLDIGICHKSSPQVLGIVKSDVVLGTEVDNYITCPLTQTADEMRRARILSL